MHIVGVIKKTKIYIIFVILLISLKNISMICYNLKVKNKLTHNFNQNQIFIKNIDCNLYAFANKKHSFGPLKKNRMTFFIGFYPSYQLFHPFTVLYSIRFKIHVAILQCTLFT